MKDDDRVHNVAAQYKTADALNVRKRLHELYTAAEEPFYGWVFERLRLAPGARVLECGCGDGALWINNINRLPEGARIVLSDLSEGMLAEAARALARFDRITADIMDLPFKDGVFDVVIANHMLYHVPDIDTAISEARRVLAPGGVFVCSTAGDDNLRELWRMCARVDNEFRAPKLSFTLENGYAYLRKHFAHVDKHLYDSSLYVTRAQAICDYIESMASFDVMKKEYLGALKLELDAQIERDGGIRIHKSAGLFRCA